MATSVLLGFLIPLQPPPPPYPPPPSPPSPPLSTPFSSRRKRTIFYAKKDQNIKKASFCCVALLYCVLLYTVQYVLLLEGLVDKGGGLSGLA